MRNTAEGRVGVDRLDTAALLARCRTGDHAAWDKLVDRYERLVYAIALREGLDREDAADVTQETFAALVRGMDTIEDPDRLGYWLMTVARRNTWRTRGRSNNKNVPIESITVTSEDWSADALRALWVYEAVQQLDEPCRSLILALFFDPDGPSYGQVAVDIGRPIGSIGPLRSRCLDRLRTILEAT